MSIEEPWWVNLVSFGVTYVDVWLRTQRTNAVCESKIMKAVTRSTVTTTGISRTGRMSQI